jgi:hypothetical protein
MVFIENGCSCALIQFVEHFTLGYELYMSLFVHVDPLLRVRRDILVAKNWYVRSKVNIPEVMIITFIHLLRVGRYHSQANLTQKILILTDSVGRKKSKIIPWIDHERDY